MNKLEERCFYRAAFLIEKGYTNLDLFQLTDLLYKIENEKLMKESINDKYLDYNDEIVSIEEVGELETIDIGVTGDNLFYCNNILTKNSFALPATVDFMIALVSSEELIALEQIMVKQLKNRYTNLDKCKRFVLGVDKIKMKLYDVEESAQDLVDDSPVMDKGDFGDREKAINKKKSKFSLNKFEGFK